MNNSNSEKWLFKTHQTGIHFFCEFPRNWTRGMIKDVEICYLHFKSTLLFLMYDSSNPQDFFSKTKTFPSNCYSFKEF